jgi:hypothetical protein
LRPAYNAKWCSQGVKQQAMWQQDAYRMIQRRAAVAGIKTRIGNHTNHESPRTTKLYHRRRDEISLDEVERIAI